MIVTIFVVLVILALPSFFVDDEEYKDWLVQKGDYDLLQYVISKERGPEHVEEFLKYQKKKHGGFSNDPRI